MSARRRTPPNAPTPALEPTATPAVSGEYRIRRHSSTSLPAARVMPAPVTGATHRGPRRFKTVEMAAARPALSSGRELHDLDFDFDFDFHSNDGADGAPKLDGRPSSQRMSVETSRPSTMYGAPPARRSGSGEMARTRASSSTMARIGPHAALLAFSGFGDPPTSLFGTPAYAARVLVRRRVLRRDLELARLRHSHDIGFFEASLRTADGAAVRTGVMLTALLFTVMTLLVWTALQVSRGALVVPW